MQTVEAVRQAGVGSFLFYHPGTWEDLRLLWLLINFGFK